MKTIVTFIFIFVVTFSFAQDKFTTTMLKNIDAVYSAKTVEEYQQVINSFDRIANAEKTKWEPYYYSAFGNLMMASREADGQKKDGYIDLAVKSLENAKAIAAADAEVTALEGFAQMLRVSVDPGARGAQMVAGTMQTLGKALSLNPDNPRALALMAQMQFGTAQFFGSSVTEACGNATKALEKFATFKSDNPLAPQWGKSMAEGLKKQCPQ
jgi:tetratricopeptide (TPR) repeat protein